MIIIIIVITTRTVISSHVEDTFFDELATYDLKLRKLNLDSCSAGSWFIVKFLKTQKGNLKIVPQFYPFTRMTFEFWPMNFVH